MRVLVLNCGSSSLKFQLIETSREQIAQNNDRVLAHGAVERVGSDDAKFTYQMAGREKEEKQQAVKDQKQAIQLAFDHLTAPGGALSHPQDVEAVGHRIVHGGEAFHESVIIDDRVLKDIEKLSDLAPLHNPENLKGYYASRELLPDAKQVAVFDTAFHQTMPPCAYLYGLPYEFYERDHIRKYGFHGTSHRYVSWRFAMLHQKKRADYKLITCHLGNGCSVCAIDHGKSIDTSMGFTPMDGLLMGTRPGEIDPGAVLYLAQRDPDGAQGMEKLLNHKAGLAGLTNSTGDMRDIQKRSAAGDQRARDAVDVFCYRVIQFIGSYATVLNGADAILFTGGIGENSSEIRAQVCQGLAWLGVELDAAANDQARGKDARITTEASKMPVWVIPTDEELLIARDTFRCIEGIPHP
jgi:acetate kinase